MLRHDFTYLVGVRVVRYSLTYQEPHRHFISFKAEFPVTGDNLELQLPSWRPGRYELGNFARNLRAMTALSPDGRELTVVKLSKDRWRIETQGHDHIVWKYQYYAAEINAGSSFLSQDIIYVNPVNCFFYDPSSDCPFQVALNLPENFKLVSSLKKEGRDLLLASSFDELADSPFVASPDLVTWEYVSSNIPFYIHLWGKKLPAKDRLIRDFQAFTDVHFRIFDTIPCDQYHFIFLFPDIPVRHGVEHQKSTVIAMGPSAGILEENRYNELLGISCHELFHTWNVKYIRPAEMKPYDFSRENYARTGYIYEGVTTYYGDLLLWRSGVFSDERYFSILESCMRHHLDNEGRFNFSVADSSWDTWLDGYVPGVPWRKVSIYNEGALLAFICDVWIMKATEMRHSLDDVMKLLYNDEQIISRGYTARDYQHAIERVAGTSFDELFIHCFHGTSDYMPYLKRALEWLGLELGFVPEADPWQSRLGMRYATDTSGQITVENVLPGCPADKAGLWKGDIICRINGSKPDMSVFPEKLHVEWQSFGVVRQCDIQTEGKTYFDIPRIQRISQQESFRFWKFRQK